jgi:hypothetical protein
LVKGMSWADAMLRYHTEQFCAAIVQDGNRLLVKRFVIRFPVVGQQSRLIVEIQPAADKAIESLESWLRRQ